jgi:hypothetical protein
MKTLRLLLGSRLVLQTSKVSVVFQSLNKTRVLVKVLCVEFLMRGI